MAHILPHWNWKGREGEVTPVYVFTSGDETDFDDFRQPRRKAFHGWAQAVIRAIPGAAGTIRVTAASGDLVPTSLPVEARLPDISGAKFGADRFAADLCAALGKGPETRE